METAIELHGAGVVDCLDLLRRRAGSHERVMIVGHDPAFRERDPTTR